MIPIPLAIFWVVLLAGRKELGPKGVLIFIAIWAAVLFAVQALGLNVYYFVATESLLDVVLLNRVRPLHPLAVDALSKDRSPHTSIRLLRRILTCTWHVS